MSRQTKKLGKATIIQEEILLFSTDTILSNAFLNNKTGQNQLFRYSQQNNTK